MFLLLHLIAGFRKYAKLLHLDERARIEGGREFPGEQPYEDFDTLLAKKAAGERQLVSKFGTYKLKDLLQPMPKEVTRERVVGVERSELATNRKTFLGRFWKHLMIALSGLGGLAAILALIL